MRTLVTGGTVVSMDPAIGDLDRADVLLEDGVIVEVAERIDAGDAEVIDIGWPETGRMLTAGLRPALSTDDSPAADLPALRTRLVESRDRIAAARGVALDGTWRPR